MSGGVCHACGGFYLTRKDGTLRWHHVGRRIHNPRCPGSASIPIPMADWLRNTLAPQIRSEASE